MSIKVLIISSDVIGTKMGGPGIRNTEIARHLSEEFEVTLVGPSQFSTEGTGLKYSYVAKPSLMQLAKLIRGHEFIITNNFNRLLPFLTRDKKTILDIYDPVLIDDLEWHQKYPVREQNRRYAFTVEQTKILLKNADFCLFSNERQKDLYLGVMISLQRVKPGNYLEDKNLENVYTMVPFGISEAAPVKTKNVMRNVIPGITEKDKILLWGGFVNNWFDPVSLIKAMSNISQKRNDIKLVFYGTTYPNPLVPKMKQLTLALEAAKEHNLINHSVFFLDDWVPYNERQNYLLEADFGVCTHFKGLETYFSHRTRILDYIWAELPILITEGGYFGDLVVKENLGVIVNYQDPDDIAKKILSLADSDSQHLKTLKNNLSKVREQLYWGTQVSSLAAYIRRAHGSVSSIHSASYPRYASFTRYLWKGLIKKIGDMRSGLNRSKGSI